MSSTPFPKYYLTPRKLITLLKKRGLIINNENSAEHLIQAIGYYRLSAYLYPLLATPKTLQIFKSESNFETAVTLYNFDQELRLFLFRYIAKIEVAIRSAIANIVAEESNNIFWMTDKTMFVKEAIFNKTKSIIDNEIRSSNEEFIKHFKAKYSVPYPPAWMLVEVLPIGTLNHVYNNLSDNLLKKKVAARFKLKEPIFRSWLTIIALTRNACAHHARIWNKENAIPPKTPKKLDAPWISSSILKNRIFFNISIIKYFIDSISPLNEMKQELTYLLKKYPTIDIAAMGFPPIWQKEPLWDK